MQLSIGRTCIASNYAMRAISQNCTRREWIYA